MTKTPAWRRYLRFWGADIDADVDDELQFHLDMRARDYERAGLPGAEARRAAVERFGDVEGVGSALRNHDRRRARGTHRREYMSDLTQDVRYGIQTLRRAPGFTTVAVLTLALGIGATTAIFSVVNAVVLRPLPYPDAERLTMVWMDNRPAGMNEDIHSWPNFDDLRTQNQVFTGLAAYFPGGFNITGGCVEGACDPERVAGVVSTADLFPILGVSPRIGRAFTAAEEQEGSDGVVVLSHGLWRRQFGADPAAIGRTVRMNGRERTVIGVMPEGFAFPSPETSAWVPLVIPEQERQARNSFGLYVIGRLKPGVPLERAQADMAAIFARLVTQFPTLGAFGINLVSLPRQIVGPTLRTALWVMLGAVGAVLLIACANVANLMLSRAAAREREVGVRIALGASRTRIVRQLLTESVLLAVLGGATGLLLAWSGLKLLIGLAPADIPRLSEVRLDALVLSLSLVVAVLTGVAFGLAPALQLSRPDLSAALREGGRGGTGGQRGQRMRRLLAAAQVALVIVLLTGAGLLIRSFVELQRVHLGFRPENLLTMRLALPVAKYQQPPQRIALYEQLTERVRSLPGVRDAAAISDIFLSKTPNSGVFTIEGRPPRPEEAQIETPIDAVTPGYFKVMGIPLTRGRDFTAQDGFDAPPVVIVNENMAQRFWPNEDPVGKRFRYGGPDSQAPWMTVVGVVGDMRRTGYDAPVRYETFLPHAQAPRGAMTLVVRTTREPLALASAVRGEVRALDPEQPVYEVRSMDDLLSGMVAQRRFSMALLGTFAALALTLGLIGVYGVTSYLVAQRTREIGLRLALGAEPRTVVGMVVRQGMFVAGAGVAVGLVGALVLTRLMGSLLYGVSASDLPTLAAATGLLAAATLVANWVPARRAARVDPLVALRAE
jgi:putative ABC transport system permease protein